MARNAWRLVLLFGGGVPLPLAGFVAGRRGAQFESFHFDAPLLWQMHGLHSPLLDRFFVLISKLGYEWFLIPADVLIIGVLLGYRRWREPPSWRSSARLLNVGSKRALLPAPAPRLWNRSRRNRRSAFPAATRWAR